MNWLTKVIVLTAIVVLVAASPSHATRDDGNKYGVGLQGVAPVAYGPSFIWDLESARLSLQGVLGMNDFPTPVVRVRYAFYTRQYLDGYAYGAIGMREDNDDSDSLELFGGIGAGVEWDWRDADPSLIPISWSLEIGLNQSDISMGIGIHYTF